MEQNIASSSKFQLHQTAVKNITKSRLDNLRNKRRQHGDHREYNVGFEVEFQLHAVQKAAQYYDNSAKRMMPVLSAVIEAPSGSGKAGMVVLLPYHLGSNKVLVVTPSTIFSKRTAAAFGFYNGDLDKPSFFEAAFGKSKAAASNLLERVDLVKTTQQIRDTRFLGNLVVMNARRFGTCQESSIMCGQNVGFHEVVKFFSKFDTLIMHEAQYFDADTWINVSSAFKASSGTTEKKNIVFLTAFPVLESHDFPTTYRILRVEESHSLSSLEPHAKG